MSDEPAPYTLQCGCTVTTARGPGRDPRTHRHGSVAVVACPLHEALRAKPRLDPTPLAMTIEERQAWAALHEAKRGIDRAIIEIEENVRRRSAAS